MGKYLLLNSYIPQNPELESFPDLGQSHRLVAMILYMDYPAHYVVLCRSHRDPSKCRLFNDLPHILRHLDVVMLWSDVPELCANAGLFPRLMLYESADTARVLVHQEETNCAQ